MSGILVIAEHRMDELRPVSLELVSAAVGLKGQNGGPVKVAVIATNPEKYVAALSAQGVDEVICVKTAVNEFDPDAYEVAVSALIAAHQLSLVLLPHSVNSLGYAPALAAKGGYGFATDVFKAEYEDGALVATRGGYGQKLNVEVDFPGKSTVVITFRANVCKPIEASGSPTVTSSDAPAVPSRGQHKRYIEAAGGDDVDIPGSEFILSIGRGVGEETNVEQFRELAQAVGAELGCSRPIADAGWLPKSRQVGQSGKTAANCKLYIAMGISGSVQHMAGMKHVETIVAVNTDPGASIFHIARYGIVGDIFEIGEELRNQLPA
jgi:electron transfer flavoprotein alpha subunit